MNTTTPSTTITIQNVYFYCHLFFIKSFPQHYETQKYQECNEIKKQKCKDL